MNKLMRSVAVILLLASVSSDILGQIPRQTNFQGLLLDDLGEPVVDGTHDVDVSLYDAPADGTALWTETHSVETFGGVFSVVLGSNVEMALDFDQQYWIGASVDGGDELSPRIALAAAPYSLRSASVEDGSITASALADGSVLSAALAPGSVTAPAISDGAIPTDKISVSGASNGQVLTVVDGSSAGWRNPPEGGGSSDAWNLTGNSGTTNDNFIGTTDSRPFDVRVNGQRAMRLQLRQQVPNTILGFSGNQIANVSGSTIAGGGREGNANQVDGDYNFIGAGTLNHTAEQHTAVVAGENNEATGSRSIVGGGADNRASGNFAGVFGGNGNLAGGDRSFVGGGSLNQATNERTVVVGGEGNQATGTHSFIGGGSNVEASGSQSVAVGGSYNRASGIRSAVPGGEFNIAQGDWSFAAGFNSFAEHRGSFVWNSRRSGLTGDTPTFKSTTGQQFLINAPGGFGVGTNAPATTAHVMRGGTGVTPFALVNDDFVVEDGDAVIGIYSGPSGSYGSGIVLAQLTNGVLTDKWGIARNSTGGGNHLRFSFGTNANYSQNNTVVRFSSVGNVYADGAFYPGGADLAESVGVVGPIKTYESGDVLAVSNAANRTFELSSEPYSTKVAGVYATQPGVLLSRHGTDGPDSAEVPMAVVGIVPTKVTAENGPIHHGDLLVASSTPGHAMKADAVVIQGVAIYPTGAILGKALESFDGTGAGLIDVLVNVQ